MMQQEIYFPKWSSLHSLTSGYTISSLLLLTGTIIFCIIVLVALIALARIIKHIRHTRQEQKLLHHDMQLFYQKQLALLHGKAFLTSLYQYAKLLVELWKWKDIHTVWRAIWYDDDTIVYMEHVIMMGNELEYEKENRIKDLLLSYFEKTIY